jgi:hypothetical protein
VCREIACGLTKCRCVRYTTGRNVFVLTTNARNLPVVSHLEVGTLDSGGPGFQARLGPCFENDTLLFLDVNTVSAYAFMYYPLAWCLV